MIRKAKYNLEFCYKTIEFIFSREGEHFLDPLIAGLGPYYMPTSVGMGGEEHSIWALMEGIYNYYKDNPDKPVAEAFYDSIKRLFENVKLRSCYVNAMKALQFQIDYEKEGYAPFTIDTKSLIDICEENFPRIKSLFNKSKDYDEFCNSMDSMLNYLKNGMQKVK